VEKEVLFDEARDRVELQFRTWSPRTFKIDRMPALFQTAACTDDPQELHDGVVCTETVTVIRAEPFTLLHLNPRPVSTPRPHRTHRPESPPVPLDAVDADIA
jgi:hypothetical protein